jgi:chromosome segregation ATPase
MSWFNGENLATSFGQIASKVQTLTEKALLDNDLDEQLDKLKQENQNLKLFLKKLQPTEETAIEEFNKFQNELQTVETLKLDLEKKGKECKEKEAQLAKIKTMAADKIKRQNIEIQDLQNQLNKSTVTDIETELKKQRVQFAESYGQLETEKEDLCEKMILLEQELAQIRANDTAGKLEELQDMICTLRAETTGLKQENLLLKQNNNHQNTEPLESILEIRGALDAANKQNEILSREIINKESTIQKSSQEIEMLKSENNILKSNVVVFDQEKGDLEIKLKESCIVLEDAQLKLQEKDQQIKRLNATLDQIEHYSSDIENLKNEIDSIMQEKQDLAMSLESSSKEAFESSQELQKAREAVQSFKIKLKESNNKTNALLSDNETLRDSLKQKIEEVHLLKNDLEKLRMISDNTKDSTKILDSESEVITELRIRLDGINNENQNLRNNIEALLDSKSRELSSVNQELYTAIDKIDVLTKELKDSKSESLDLKQKIESLKTSNTNDELLSLRQKLESLERENDSLNISIQKSLEESFELKKELDSINIAAAERSISNSEGFQQIKAENLNLKNEIEKLKELLENAKEDLKELTAKLVTKNDESDNEKSAEISYLQGKNVELEEKFILLQSQINEKEQELISANEAASYLKELNSQYKLKLKDSNDTGMNCA